MSRSFKKTPVRGVHPFDSEKQDKQKWHRRLRKKIRQLLSGTHYDIEKLESTVLPTEHDVSDPWLMSKDGKFFMSIEPDSDEAKVNWFKKLMRK